VKKTRSLSAWYLVPTWIIAIMAIVGFVYSIESVSEYSEQLKQMSQALAKLEGKYFRPMVQLGGYRWGLGGTTKVISCSNPPTSIHLIYVNVSNVPLKIHHYEVNLYYGREQFMKRVEHGSNELILGPKGTFKYAFHGIELYTRNPKNPDEEPLIRIKSKIQFRSLDDESEYTYQATHVIPFSCSSATKPPVFAEIDSPFRTEAEDMFPNHRK